MKTLKILICFLLFSVSLILSAQCPVTISSSGTLCDGNTVKFTAQITGTGTYTYKWLKGKTQMQIGTASTYTTSAFGDYSVVIIDNVTNKCTSDTITINPNPTCSLSSNINPPLCEGTNITFLATAGPSSSKPFIYQWKYNNGNIGTNVSTYTDNGAGTYLVIVTDKNTCTVTSNSLTIYQKPAIPDFKIPDKACANTTFSFTNILPVGMKSYTWNFGGDPPPQTLPDNRDVSHSFLTAIGNNDKVFNVTLTVTNAEGCQNKKNQDLTVQQIPDARLKSDETAGFENRPPTGPPFTQFINCGGIQPYILTLNNLSTSNNKSYLIAWGDGFTNTYSNFSTPPQHTYSSVGTYILTNTVTGANDCVTYMNYEVFIGTNPKNTTITNTTYTTGECAPKKYKFKVIYGPEDAPGTQYIIEHNDDPNSTTLTKPFPPGTLPDTIEHEFKTSSCGAANAHKPNTFWISITAINACGMSSTNTFEPIVLSSAPKPSFDISPPPYCANSPQVDFTSTSNGGGYVYWDAGSRSWICDSKIHLYWSLSGIKDVDWQVIVPGNLGTPNNFDGSDKVSIKFITPGQYTMSLITGNKGLKCSQDTLTKTICVRPQPNASFKVDPPSQTSFCAPGNIIFTNNSSAIDETCAKMSYTWSINCTNPHCNTANCGGYSFVTPTNVNSKDAKINFTQPGIYTVKLTVDNGCTPATTSQTITVKTKPTVSIINVPSNSICEGKSFNPTATITNCYCDTNSLSYSWSFITANPASSTSQNPGFITYTKSGNVNFTVTNCCGSSSDSKSITVSTPKSVSVSIIASANPVCAGTPITFTATPTNPGTSPSYQWKLGGVDILGATNITYIYTPSNGDKITCVLTSSEGCTSGNPATSNQIIMTVNPNLPVSVSITVSKNPICIGESVTFTATPTNGGTTPSYQWKVNGTNVGTNSTTNSYSYKPNDGDIITCVITSNAAPCATGNPATSNAITMTVNTNLTVSVTIIASSNPVCEGTNVTFTANTTNGGTNPSYQWKLGGTNIIGATNSTYTYIPKNGDIITCFITSNTLCTIVNNATSNSITMIVNPNLPVSVTITGINNICEGTLTTFTANSTNGGVTPSYQWKVNGKAILNETNSTYTYTPNDKDIIVCVVTSNALCPTGNPATSNIITMKVNPLPDANAGTSDIICIGTSIQIGSNQVPGNKYGWTSNPGNFSSNISNPTVNPTVTTTYTLTDTITATKCHKSNYVIITVFPLSVGGITSNDITICYDSITSITLSGETGKIQWQQSMDGGIIWIDVSGGSGSNTNNYTTPNLTSTTYYRAVVTSGVCPPATSNVVKVTVDKLTVIIDPSTPPCKAVSFNGNITLTAIPNPNNQNPTYIWSPTQNLDNPNNDLVNVNGVTSNITYNVKVTDKYKCTANANVCLNVNEDNCKFKVVGKNIICIGDNVTLKIDDYQKGRTYKWTDNEIPPLNTNADSIVVTPSVTTTYTVKAFINGFPCNSSENYIITVVPLPIPSFIIKSPFDTLVGCKGQQLIFENKTTKCEDCSWEWDFGNGDKSFLVTPLPYTYKDTGDYIITLTAIPNSDNACKASYQQRIHITDIPVPNFILSPDKGCGPFKDTITNKSTGEFIKYYWEFGLNNDNSIGTGPFYKTYPPGLLQDTTYIIKLTTSNLCGSASKNVNISVYTKPVVDFRYSGKDCSIAAITLEGIFKGVNPESLCWDFGDTCSIFCTKSTNAFIHKYKYTGLNDDTTYHITLSAANKCGSNSITKDIKIKPKNVQANFIYDKTVICSGDIVTFTNESFNRTSTLWYFGDGTTSSSNDKTIKHKYIIKSRLNPITFTVRLIVDNICGSDTFTLPQIITVKPVLKPEFSIINDYNCTRTPVMFNCDNPKDSIQLAVWRFNDNTQPDSSMSTYYTYKNPGTYKDTLTIFNFPYGCKSDTVFPVHIKYKPNPDFTFSPKEGCSPLEVIFNNTDILQDNKYTWYSNSRCFSISDNPTEKFLNNKRLCEDSLIKIKLIVRNGDCKDSSLAEIKVHHLPKSEFSSADSKLCDFTTPVNLKLIDNSSCAILSEWYLDDKLVDTNPYITLTEAKEYNLKLKVKSKDGCEDSSTLKYIVYPDWKNKISINPAKGCEPLGVIFKANVDTLSYLWNIEWDFGDKNVSTKFNNYHIYQKEGVYSIKLKVSGEGNCTDSITLIDEINVYPRPLANFDIILDNQDRFKHTAIINDLSTGANNWIWNFEDTTVYMNTVNYSSIQKHNFFKSKKYKIILTVENSELCSDSTYRYISIDIKNACYIPNCFTPDKIGLNQNFGPVFMAPEDINEFEFYIFNRWGQLMYKTNINDRKYWWDGNYQNNKCPQAGYVYLIKFKNYYDKEFKEIRGKIILLR